MVSSVEVRPRTTTGGCGIYEIGHPDCCQRAFITDYGRVKIVGIITEEDLVEVYNWGRLEEKKTNGLSADPPYADAVVVNDIYQEAINEME